MKRIPSILQSLYVKVMACAVAFCILATQSASAQTITDNGIDLAAMILLAIALLGTVIAAVLGGYFSFVVIKLGIRWIGKLGG